MTRRRSLTTVASTTLAIVALGATALLSGAPSVVTAAYGPHDRVTVCHRGDTIKVSRNALGGHQRHGDSIGPCRQERTDGDGREGRRGDDDRGGKDDRGGSQERGGGRKGDRD